MDPLSDVLSLLKPRSYRCGGFDVGGELSVQFGRHEGIKCYALVSGECWLAVEGIPDAVHLKAGDCFLLPRGLPFRLATDLTVTPIDALAFFAMGRNGSIITLNGGGDCFIVGGHFLLAGGHASVLLSVLPPIVHIRSESDKAELCWALDRMRQEIREERPGSVLVAQQLAYMMLVQALRLHLEEGLTGGVGWIFALANRQMNAAITSMHDDPAHGWTLQQLAERAGMSRSIFALKFKELVGTSPMEYLTRWRMMLAGDRLKNTDDPVSTIALSLGYESESAFSKAFKRVMGCSPRQYGRGFEVSSGARGREEDVLTDRHELVAG
ncbi:MAG: AraC family transcriptional regulator [Acidobacteriota bacterium]|nr:AraC family transcriptional regulator [Acidobacteriota bacterium]